MVYGVLVKLISGIWFVNCFLVSVSVLYMYFNFLVVFLLVIIWFMLVIVWMVFGKEGFFFLIILYLRFIVLGMIRMLEKMIVVFMFRMLMGWIVILVVSVGVFISFLKLFRLVCIVWYFGKIWLVWCISYMGGWGMDWLLVMWSSRLFCNFIGVKIR